MVFIIKIASYFINFFFGKIVSRSNEGNTGGRNSSFYQGILYCIHFFNAIGHVDNLATVFLFSPNFTYCVTDIL